MLAVLVSRAQPFFPPLYSHTSFFSQVGYVALIAYFLSRIIILCGNGPRANISGKGKMLLFSISALVFTVLSLVCAVQCVLNFDHGLKSVIVNSGKVDRVSYQFQTISNLESNGRHSRLGLD